MEYSPRAGQASISRLWLAVKPYQPRCTTHDPILPENRPFQNLVHVCWGVGGVLGREVRKCTLLAPIMILIMCTLISVCGDMQRGRLRESSKSRGAAAARGRSLVEVIGRRCNVTRPTLGYVNKRSRGIQGTPSIILGCPHGYQKLVYTIRNSLTPAYATSHDQLVSCLYLLR